MEFIIITNYENYGISSTGLLKNFKTNRVLKTFKGGSGYEYCRIINNDGYKKTTIHNLVAKFFIGDKPDGFEVHHIDRNKLNNNVNNLKYVSKSENCLNRNVSTKKRKNRKDEYYNITKIINNDKYVYYIVKINQKYYGCFKTLDDAIKKRDLIISTINI